MKLSSAQLPQHLTQSLKPIYLLTSSEPLLVQETRERLIQAAKQQGYSETELMTVEPRFDWQTLPASAANLSLFADKKILDCRLGSSKPGDAGLAALTRFGELANPDCLLIISADKLDAATQKSRWVKLIDELGVIITLWAPNPKQFLGWIAERAEKQGLRLSKEAIALIADRTEGNLLAASQECEKLSLLYGNQAISLAQAEASVLQASRFDLFQLVDTALSGDKKRSLHMLMQLRGEGLEPTLILWGLTRELRSLSEMAFQLQAGKNLAAIFQAHRTWDTRKPLLQQALKRLSLARCYELMHQAQETDATIKGLRTGQVWDQLTQLTLGLTA